METAELAEAAIDEQDAAGYDVVSTQLAASPRVSGRDECLTLFMVFRRRGRPRVKKPKLDERDLNHAICLP